MAHVIDSDVLIDVTKGNAAAVAYLESLDDCAISTITAMELIVGASTQKQSGALDESLRAFEHLPLTPAIGTSVYDLLKHYARSHGLRPFDALIAATALAGNHSLVTRNTKHFRFISDLNLISPKY